ncbi:SHOCT domain-containing protein [Streptomyces abikoensis]|uniref:SHOCT domain-containing protein n=1 Tax=Streptomyces abikoensis TaxID=97398 RepID=UPI00167AEFD6|nr:SHOCT domain-containing protein [Streptomyces abikoensis]GGP36930.1 membrane protein [Streptomyces abikoensis]
MFWYDHGVGGWGLFAMAVSMILFWVLIITAVVLLFRALARPSRGGPYPDWRRGQAPTNAEQILAERYARGEIDEEEYARRLATLRGSPPGDAGQ